MSTDLKEGDVVQLKSGGPKMTVANVSDVYGEPTIWCMWFDGSKRIEDQFKPTTLKKIEENS